MKKGLGLIVGVVAMASLLWAGAFKTPKLISGSASGDVSAYQTQGIVQLTIDTGADSAYGTISTEELNTEGERFAYAYIRLYRTTIDTAGYQRDSARDGDTIIATLKASMNRGSGLFDKTLGTIGFNDTGQKIFVLGQGLDTLLYRQMWFDIYISDTTDDSANSGRDPLYHFNFGLGAK